MKRLFAVSALLAGILTSAAAQEFKTSYFLDNYVYNYRLNPAASFESKPFTFFSVGLGNTSVSIPTNLSVSSFIFKTPEGNLTWGLASSVPTEKFLGGLDKDNFLAPQLSLNVLSFGRQSDDWRLAFEVNLRSNSYLYAPYDFFAAFKNGINDGLKNNKKDTYSFQNMHFNTSNYAEIAASYSHKIGDNLIVGGTAKALLGILGGSFDIYNMAAEPLPGDKYGGTANAEVKIASKALDISTAVVEGKSLYNFETAGFKGFGFSGYGFGVDLGVTWKPIDGLEIGLSALDLGMISWQETHHGYINYEKKQFNDVEDALEIEAVETEVNTTMLDYNIHLSTKYRMPFYEGLSVGLLGTYQKHFKEARLGLDVTPISAISIAASAAINTYGTDFGAAINFRFPGVNLFLGADSIYFKMTPEMIPETRGLTNLTLGLAIAF
ncbi:MAG: hypothetical protein J6O51_10145 [Bacteroidales bacterium]|nr:hypothetical protein [Bacteroidales bacterium]